MYSYLATDQIQPVMVDCRFILQLHSGAVTVTATCQLAYLGNPQHQVVPAGFHFYAFHQGGQAHLLQFLDES